MLLSSSMLAVTPREVCGQFDGDLNIDGQPYPNKSVYLLPGVVDNTLTFVLPDFMYGAGKLGNIVLPNIPMSQSGQLTLENATLYLDSISERATITIINGLEDGGVVYNSTVSPTEAQVILSIEAPSLPEAIYVLFQGKAAKTNNYLLPNNGFEGDWTKNEPQGWHSFTSASGLMAAFVCENSFQFTQSTDIRPGSKGKNSALLTSAMIFGVKANGNCTNGRVNAGSMTADDAAGNFNYSDPDSVGYNTPFNGRPDSIVFWVKYQPADRDASNEENRARMNTVITTNARYQDPETEDCSAIKIGAAEVNYAATASLDWQRIAVPFVYAADSKSKTPAYILTTFSTSYRPGGGTSYTTGKITKTNVLDSVYIDDVDLIYNRCLKSVSVDDHQLTFSNGVAHITGNYCDDCAPFAAQADGFAAQTFLAFDGEHKCLHIYVIGDNYAQTGEYNLYRVEFDDTDFNTAVPEVLNDWSRNNNGWQKTIIDGALYIITPSGDIYDVHGAKLK